MSADQNRSTKKLGKSNKGNRGSSKEPAGKPSDTDQSLNRPYEGYDEEKINRPDPAQQIGEFSNWSKTK
jgi:hypothetical protein